MELNVIGNEMRAEADAGQSFVGFEADRIALRRVFESDRGALLAEQRSSR
jgi:hypothetical protein